MALARWQATIVDEAGNVQTAATVTVRSEALGNPLASLFSDRAGVTPTGNPVTSDADGAVGFFLAGGAYWIEATKGAFSRTWRYVAVGTAQEHDEDYFQLHSLALDAYPLPLDGSPLPSLGSDALGWGNLFLTEGGSIDFGSGDIAITHLLEGSPVASVLSFTGASESYRFDNTVNILPSANTLQRGVDIVQSGPTSGSSGTDVFFNRILPDATNVQVTGDVVGFEVRMGTGGSNAQGQRIAVVGYTVQNTAAGSLDIFRKVYTGGSFIGQGSTNDGGTSTANSTDAQGYVLGVNACAFLNGSATNYLHAAGLECLTTVRTGASVRTHVGARIVQFFDHAVSGANLDAGLQFINQTGAVGWEDYGIIFDTTSDDAGTLFKSTATVLGVTGTPTITHGIDFQTVSFTGAAFRSNGFFVNGSGDIFGPSLTGGLNASSNLVIKSTGGVGTTDFIAFRVGNNGATEAARIVNAGQIIVGHTAAIAVNSEAGSAFTPQFEIHATGAGATESITRWSADANPGRFVMAKSRGASIATRGAVVASDVLGLILFNGDDGTNFLPGAYIRASVDGTPGANDLPTQLSFAVTADGAATPTQWMTLRQNGILESAGGQTFLNATAPAAGGNAAHGIKFSSTADLGIFFGTGAPNFTANRGSLYVNTTATTTTTRLYINNASGSGNSWTNLTTAA